MNDSSSQLAVQSRLALAALLACVLAGCGRESEQAGTVPAAAPPPPPAAAATPPTPRPELTPAQAEAMKYFSVERRESAEAAVEAVEEAERNRAQAVEEASNR